VSTSRFGQASRASFRDERLTPYRALAVRVISLAVRDLIAPGPARSDRDTARAFFSNSGMLNHWCKLADLDPDIIRTRLQDVLDGNGHGTPPHGRL
jgi:hypothetical protein